MILHRDDPGTAPTPQHLGNGPKGWNAEFEMATEYPEMPVCTAALGVGSVGFRTANAWVAT